MVCLLLTLNKRILNMKTQTQVKAGQFGTGTRSTASSAGSKPELL
jgi:hypothetical protein